MELSVTAECYLDAPHLLSSAAPVKYATYLPFLKIVFKKKTSQWLKTTIKDDYYMDDEEMYVLFLRVDFTNFYFINTK